MIANDIYVCRYLNKCMSAKYVFLSRSSLIFPWNLNERQQTIEARLAYHLVYSLFLATDHQ